MTWYLVKHRDNLAFPYVKIGHERFFPRPSKSIIHNHPINSLTCAADTLSYNETKQRLVKDIIPCDWRTRQFWWHV